MSVCLSSTDLNNEACFLVKLRRYDEAMAYLKRALSSIKAEVHAHQVVASSQRKCREYDATHCVDDEALFETEAEMSAYYFSRYALTSPQNEDSSYFYEDHGSDDDLTESIYAKLVVIHADDSRFFALRSFAITFNLAVANHLRSIELRREGNNLLSLQTVGLAKQLYTLALQIEGIEMCGAHLPVACYNNLAKACRSLGSYEEAECYGRLVLSNLILLIDTGYLSAPSKIVNGFMKNVTYLLLRSPAVAAAA
jgi:tetratricopeptide (TPR) repeat protein